PRGPAGGSGGEETKAAGAVPPTEVARSARAGGPARVRGRRTAVAVAPLVRRAPGQVLLLRVRRPEAQPGRAPARGGARRGPGPAPAGVGARAAPCLGPAAP